MAATLVCAPANAQPHDRTAPPADIDGANARQQQLNGSLQKPVELFLDLVLDGGNKAEINKIELVGDMGLSERLRSVDRSRSPAFGVAAE